MAKKIILLLVCLLIQGCVTVSSYKLTPQISQGQTKLDREGIVTVAATDKTKKVGVIARAGELNYSAADQPTIVVGVNGIKPFDFSTDNIKAYVDGSPHKVYTYEDLVSAIKERYRVGKIAIDKEYEELNRLAADNSKKDASNPSVFSPSQLDGPNVVGNSYKQQYKYDFDEMNSTKTEAAEKAKSSLKGLTEELEEDLKKINSTALQKTTVPANEWFQRQITLEKIEDPDKPHTIKIVINVMDEETTFTFNTSKS